MQRIAVRKFDLDDCPATDTLFRVGNVYMLHMRVIGHPTEPEHIEECLTEAQANDWLESAPEQIAMRGDCKVLVLDVKTSIDRSNAALA